MISVRNLEFFRLGNCSLSRNKGLASISFFSSTSIIALADFVSPYLESCSFSLIIQKQKLLVKKSRKTKHHDNNESRPMHIQKWGAGQASTLPKVLQGQKLCDLLKQLLVE